MDNAEAIKRAVFKSVRILLENDGEPLKNLEDALGNSVSDEEWHYAYGCFEEILKGLEDRANGKG